MAKIRSYTLPEDTSPDMDDVLWVDKSGGVTRKITLTTLRDTLGGGALVATGAQPGATSQAQTFINGITLSDTTVSGSGVDNFIVNSAHNAIESGTTLGTIGGGGNALNRNLIGAPGGLPYGPDFTPSGWAADTGYVANAAKVALICGGYDHIVNQLAGVIVGGGHNFMKYNSGGHSIIGGGGYNLISSAVSGIFSGTANTITGDLKGWSFIGGGYDNNIVGTYSAIVGGYDNDIAGDYAFAWGHRAKANNNGVVVFTDSTDADFTCATADSFNARFANGYALTGGRLTISESISMPDTTTAGTGIIYKGAFPFLHNFHHPTGGGAIPIGDNTFIGIGAGNITMGSTATATYEASSNVAIGVACFTQNTTGWGNAVIGSGALASNTTGLINVAIGTNALPYNTTGSSNLAIGRNAGMFHANGSTPLVSPEQSIYIGESCRGYNDSDANSIVIGYSAIGAGANTTVIGNTSTVLTALPGGALRLTEMTAPTGTANNATLYCKDNGSGKTVLCCKLGGDVEIVLATQA